MTSGRIVFIGSSDTGHVCCERLLEEGVDVALIVTRASRFSISWSPAPVTNVRHRDFHALGAAHGVPVLDAGQPDSALRDRIAALSPDLLVVVGWYHMLPRAIRALARHGAVGVHASLLPQYRGGAPLVWAMIRGESHTGVTLFHLDDGVDDGDVVEQTALEIGERETIADGVERANQVAVHLVTKYVPAILAGAAPRTPQDHARATVMPQRRPEDGRVDWWALTAAEAHNWIRAQTRPYPGAFTYLAGERVTVWRADRADAVEATDVPPGTVVTREGRVLVGCADGLALALREIEIGKTVLEDEALQAYFMTHPASRFQSEQTSAL